MAMFIQRTNSFGGLKVRNETEININFFCRLCKLLLFDPTQLLCCGTRLCSWCSKHGLPNGQPFVCFFCNTKQPKKEALSDKDTGRELNLITAECYTCSWKGSYEDYKNHLQEYHANLKCDDCHETFSLVNSFEEHRQEICENRCMPCGLPRCMAMVKWSEMEAHYFSEKHKKTLVELIREYISRKKKSTDIRGSVDTTESLSPDRTQSGGEHDRMKTIREQSVPKSENISRKCYRIVPGPLLNDDSTVAFPFNNHEVNLNLAFSISSPIFKTLPFGYPFMLRLCSTIEPGRDNEGYLSIFISLLRGHFDSILFYPFSYNICLCLCDQTGQRNDIISTIKPAFARPTSEKNAEIGIIKFCPLNYLTDAQSVYVSDGVFFIRVFIDFMNTGLNPFSQ